MEIVSFKELLTESALRDELQVRVQDGRSGRGVRLHLVHAATRAASARSSAVPIRHGHPGTVSVVASVASVHTGLAAFGLPYAGYGRARMVER